MWADLDMAELGEVNRRVVTPVVEAMMRTGELCGVEIGVGLPPGWSPGALDVVDCPVVWVRLLAADDELVVQLGKITMERWSSQQLVEELVEAINDWVPETSFGWGERPERQGPAELPAADDAPTVLRFYPDDAARWPLCLEGSRWNRRSWAFRGRSLTDWLLGIRTTRTLSPTTRTSQRLTTTG